jgi:hypothetical protein
MTRGAVLGQSIEGNTREQVVGERIRPFGECLKRPLDRRVRTPLFSFHTTGFGPDLMDNLKRSVRDLGEWLIKAAVRAP